MSISPTPCNYEELATGGWESPKLDALINLPSDKREKAPRSRVSENLVYSEKEEPISAALAHFHPTGILFLNVESFTIATLLPPIWLTLKTVEPSSVKTAGYTYFYTAVGALFVVFGRGTSYPS